MRTPTLSGVCFSTVAPGCSKCPVSIDATCSFGMASLYRGEYGVDFKSAYHIKAIGVHLVGGEAID